VKGILIHVEFPFFLIEKKKVICLSDGNERTGKISMMVHFENITLLKRKTYIF
jgi:hypothetical protein